MEILRPLTGQISEAEPSRNFPQQGLGPSRVVVIATNGEKKAAIEELVASLPSKTGMTYVLAGDADAEGDRTLAVHAVRHAAMPVVDLSGRTRLEPDHVYVARCPALEVKGDSIQFSQVPQKFPLDHLFRSLAEEQAHRSVGILLALKRSDGALGLRAIKNAGGITIARLVHSMGTFADVDLVLSSARMGAELGRLAQVGKSAQSFLQANGARVQGTSAHICSLIRQCSGLDLDNYDLRYAKGRIARRYLLSHARSLDQYAAILERTPGEVRQLVHDFLSAASRFFDPAAGYKTLTTHVFPQLFRTKLGGEGLRIWVPGCATGEEVYSVAIALQQYADSLRMDPSFRVFGTDLNPESIRIAGVGIYPESIEAEVSSQDLSRFFERVDGGYRICREIREKCTFGRQNLLVDPPYSRLDLISCHKVLPQLTPERRREVLQSIHYGLQPHGILWLDPGEAPEGLTEYFSASPEAETFFRRSSAPVRPPSEIEWGAKKGLAALDVRVRENAPQESGLRYATERLLLARLESPVFVVDQNLTIRYSRGKTASFLSVTGGIPSVRLAQALHPDIVDVVVGTVSRSIQEDIPILSDSVFIRDGDLAGEITVEVFPLDGLQGLSRYYAILLSAKPSLAQPALLTPPMQELPSPAVGSSSEFAQLRRASQSTRQYLHTLIAERESINRELAFACEEMQAQNEELRSTNQELAAAKDEIESVNRQLAAANRGMNDANRSLTHARDDLDNLLGNVNDPVIILNRKLEVRQFTPSARRVFNVRSEDIGRPFGEISANIPLPNLPAIAEEVIASLQTKEVEVQDPAQVWHLVRVRPFRTSEDSIEGVVLSVFDIDSFRRAEQALQAARDFSRTIIQSLPIPIAVLDRDLTIKMANPAFQSLANADADLEGRFFPDLAIAHWQASESLPDKLREIRDQPAGTSFQLEHQSARGYITLTGLAMKLAGARALLLTVEDVTPRKKAHEALIGERDELKGKIEASRMQLEQTQSELRGLAAKLFVSQEDERRRVARELHDDITQQLALLAMDMETLEASQVSAEQRPENSGSGLSGLRERIAVLAQDVRQISHRLHPAMLEELGLPVALQALTEEFRERERMQADFLAVGVPGNIPPEVAATLYRITQESLRNVAKHAGPTHVKVSLRGTGEGLRLTIADFGKGFEGQANRRGLGLVSMTERARLISGTVKIESKPNLGTSVEVDVPVIPPSAKPFQG